MTHHLQPVIIFRYNLSPFFSLHSVQGTGVRERRLIRFIVHTEKIGNMNDDDINYL